MSLRRYAWAFEHEQQPAPIMAIAGTGWMRAAVLLESGLYCLLPGDVSMDMTTRGCSVYAREHGLEQPMSGYLVSMN